MKKIIYMCIASLFLLSFPSIASTYNINQPSGTISVTGTNYVNNMYEEWNIDIGTRENVRIYCTINVENSYDRVVVHEVDDQGNLQPLSYITGTNVNFTTVSTNSTGKLKIYFVTDGSVCGSNGYSGFTLQFAADKSSFIGDDIHVGGNAFLKGNVGVRTLTPNALFAMDVNGSTRVTNTLWFSPYADPQAGNSMKLVHVNGGNSYIDYPTNLHFRYTGSTTNLSILSNGNIGIGTLSPQTKLQVQGSVYIPSGNSYWIGSYTDSGNRLRMHHTGTEAYIDYLPNLYLRSGTNMVASFLSNGNVGIGILTPTQKLEVVGNQLIDGNLQIGRHRGHDNVPVGYVGKLDFGWYENLDEVWISRYNRAKDCSDLRINIGDDCGGDKFAVGCTFYGDQEWKESFTVVANGNVGIGETNPQNKLDVNGTIRAKEVKIESSGWSDFVFAPNYKLRSLESVSKHIEEHKHLPDMPSAAEVEKEGINLSEMQAKLLQKIEELTLYAIEQNKAIAAQQKEIEELKKELKK